MTDPVAKPDYESLLEDIATEKNSENPDQDEIERLEGLCFLFNVTPPMTDEEKSLFGYIRLNSDTTTFGTDPDYTEGPSGVYVGDSGDSLDYLDFQETDRTDIPQTGGSPLYDKTGRPIYDSNGIILTKENITFSVSDINTKLLSIS
jgi:hypothetical protein